MNTQSIFGNLPASNPVTLEEYLAYLEKGMAEAEEQAPLPQHALQEMEIKENRQLRIVCSLPMPARIQFLHIEESMLRNELRGVVADGGLGGKEYADLCEKIETTHKLVMDWLIAGIAAHRQSALQMSGKGFFPRIGANWRALVVVENNLD